MMKQELKFDKITDYLFEVTYDSYEHNIDKAKAYFAKYKPNLGGCSSLQNGAFRGRNYDWIFDEEPEFVIHVPANGDGRHASIGVAATTAVTASDVESGEYLDMYDLLPYLTLDGMNDTGLTVNINVVGFGEMGEFQMRTEDSSDDVCPLMVTRLLLDNAGSIDEAISMLQDMDIFSLSTMEECHFMITGKQSAEDDTINTIVVELIPNAQKHYELSIIDYNKGEFVDNKPVMTNFHLTGFNGNVESATRHPMGLERYKLLMENYNQAQTLRGIMDLMKKVYYTRAYDLYIDNFWYSEYSGGELDMTNCGEKSLKGDVSAAGPYAEKIQKQIDDYNRGERDGSTWHTVHTSIYDTENAKLYVLPQEAGFPYEFGL